MNKRRNTKNSTIDRPAVKDPDKPEVVVDEKEKEKRQSR